MGIYALKLLAFRKKISEVETYVVDVNTKNNPPSSWLLKENDDDTLSIQVKLHGKYVDLDPVDLLKFMVEDILLVSFHSRTRTYARRSTAPHRPISLSVSDDARTQENRCACSGLDNPSHIVFTVPNVQPTSMATLYRDVAAEIFPEATVHYVREPHAAFLNEYYKVSKGREGGQGRPSFGG